jgi:Protein of unknown function (DUF4236)
MGFRFRRTLGVGGFRWTVSRRGVGTSWGLGGIVRFGVSPDGRRYVSVRVPGTGLSWIKYSIDGASSSPDACNAEFDSANKCIATRAPRTAPDTGSNPRQNSALVETEELALSESAFVEESSPRPSEKIPAVEQKAGEIPRRAEVRPLSG